MQDLLQQGIDQVIVACSQALDAAGVNGVLKSLIVDGIFQGVGSVLSFLPIIVTLFFFLSILEIVDIWQGLRLLWINFCERLVFPEEVLYRC